MSTSGLSVVLVGGSGFLGRGLRERLAAEDHRVTVIGRGPSASHDGWEHIHWDARTLGEWTSALDGADVIVHLAGKRVDCRPTKSNIDELISSRADTVRLVGQAVARMDNPPASWVQLSSLAIFGDSGEEIITEETPVPSAGLRQQVEVCRQWENAFADATTNTPRTVLLRPGIAIGGEGDPASKQLARLARFGLGGPVGSGQQWVSWIGADDFFEVLCRAVTDQTMSGLFHVTGPEPVRNRELMAAYRKATGRSFGLPAPRFITKIGASLLGSDPALALTGRRCLPARLLDEGTEFEATSIDDAVAAALN